MDPYIDFTGRVTGYVVVNIAELMGDYDWRLTDTNVWKVERVLLDHPHRPLPSSDERVDRLRARYRAFRSVSRTKAGLSRAERWSPLPGFIRVDRRHIVVESIASSSCWSEFR